MTASEKAKKAGLNNLNECVELTGKPRQTLDNWHKSDPEFFDLVLAGCVEVKRRLCNGEDLEAVAISILDWWELEGSEEGITGQNKHWGEPGFVTEAKKICARLLERQKVENK